MKPRPEEFEKWNEEHAIKHDLDKFYNHPNRLFRFIENKRISVLINKADIHDTDKVLEIGCGAGHILERIINGKLTGIDISPVQIERARVRLGKKAELFVVKGEELPFEDKFFERIICTEVFEHVLEPTEIIKEMYRVLKDDGIISLSIPNENLIMFTKKLLLNTGFRWVLEPRKSEWDLASKNNLDEWHIHNYSLKLIKKQVIELFNIISITRIPFYFIPFRYVLKLNKRV